MRIFTSILLFLLPTIVFAVEKGAYIAEVVRIRGEATQLSPGAKMARAVEIGDKFIEDTSIVTGAKSFLKIKFIDNSEMNVGPESKIVIAEMKKESPGVISLLKGRIRTEVQKDATSNTNKLFIKTRTAAMGVRGTDFQTIYNPDNKMTSLLTYRGEVAMARVDEKTYQKLEEAPEKTIERNDVTKDVEVKEVPAKKLDEASELNKILKSNTTVLVPPGQNSFASDALKKASLPVKISPVQLEVLYKNKEFAEKSRDNINAASEAEKPITTTLKVADQKAPAEGLFNEKTGDFAPKAGGYIDIATGLYIAPEADAKLDKEKGVYVSKKVGDIDADTGQYVAPKGLVLDAKKGFVLASEADKKPELLALKEDLNKTIAKDVVIKDEEAVEVPFNIEEKFIRDRIALSVWGLDQDLKLNANRNSAPYVGLYSNSSVRFGFDWIMSSNNRFSPLVGIDYGVLNFSGQRATQQSKKTLALSFGTQFALSKVVNLFGKVGLHQEHFIDQTDSFSYDLKKVTLTRLTLGANSEFWRGKRFSLDAKVAGFFTFRKKINNLIIKNGSGVQFEVMPKLAFGNHSWIGLGIQSENQLQWINGSFGGADNKQERKSAGVFLRYIHDL